MPTWLQDPRKVLPLGIVIGVLLTLLVTAPQLHAGSSSNNQSLQTTTPNAQQSAAATAPTGPAAATSIAPAGQGVAAVPSGASAFRAGGVSSVAGSGVGAGGGGASYRGVLDKTIKMGFTWQHQSCGNYTDAAVAAGFGVPQPDPQTSITSAIKYFEKFPNNAFPGLPTAIAKGATAASGYWGRRITPILADNGGPVCADKARATATALVEQDKAFGTVQVPNDGTNQDIAPVMAAHKAIDIGGPGLTRTLYNQWQPYVYDVTFSGSDVVDAWASWACRDIVGKNSRATGDPTTASKKRVLAIVYPDAPIPHALAKEAANDLKACGGSFAVNLAYSTDISQQGDIAANAIAQFRSQGVTSVYMLTDPLFTATLTSASTSQAYFPEWMVSSIGFNDVAFVVEHFYDKQQQKNVFGISYLSSSTAPAWHDQQAYKAWKMVNPDTEPPGDWNNWFLQIEVLYAGILGAGPNLTPATFLSGLQRVCGPCHRTSVKDAYVGFGPGDTTGVDDFTIVTYNTNKPDYHDPGDGTGRQAVGDWDYPENGLRYYKLISHPEH